MDRVGDFGPGRFPGGVDTGVSVLAITLRFAFGVLLILAAVWVIREILAAIRGRRALVPPEPSPAITELELLYVRGEISRADYLTRRADLTGVPHTAPPPV
ncbi:MAG: hypothetical protein M3019_05465 [Candidatus Dormibacteraeota bacterium]|nr:hypothetical protein [Candidatus Dormibacteraeota bacterium]